MPPTLALFSSSARNCRPVHVTPSKIVCFLACMDQALVWRSSVIVEACNKMLGGSNTQSIAFDIARGFCQAHPSIVAWTHHDLEHARTELCMVSAPAPELNDLCADKDESNNCCPPRLTDFTFLPTYLLIGSRPPGRRVPKDFTKNSARLTASFQLGLP